MYNNKSQGGEQIIVMAKRQCEMWEDYGSVTEVIREENSIALKCL